MQILKILDKATKGAVGSLGRFTDRLEATGIAGEAAEPWPRSKDQIAADRLAADRTKLEVTPK